MPQSAPRLSTECQIYSRRYYEDHVKLSVEAAIDNLGGPEYIDAGQCIVITNKYIADVYSKETDEVKEEIRLALEEERKVKEALKELDKAIINPTNEVTLEQALM
jgi:hypothetical protein